MASDESELLLAGLRVLLIDDEALVRLTTADMLEFHGAVVSERESAAAAFEALGTGTRFDVVICDLSMPGTNGAPLPAEIRQRHPRLPMLVISGHGTADSGDGALRWLKKPFRPDELIEAVLTTISDGADSSD